MVAQLHEPIQASLLITDDDAVCRARFRDVFAERGYETFVAACGSEAISIVRSCDVHVAILDMHLPDMTGLDTLTRIQKEMGHYVPAILVSHDQSKELQLKALAARFAAYLSKPVRLDVLGRAVEDLVAKNYPGTLWPDHLSQRPESEA